MRVTESKLKLSAQVKKVHKIEVILPNNDIPVRCKCGYIGFDIYVKMANRLQADGTLISKTDLVQIMKISCKRCKNTLEVKYGIIQSDGRYDKRGS